MLSLFSILSILLISALALIMVIKLLSKRKLDNIRQKESTYRDVSHSVYKIPDINYGKPDAHCSIEEYSHKVFISYSRQDMDVAEKVCGILKDNNIDYWIDKEGIYSSSNYKELIVDAIDSSRAVIFISSTSSNSSINVIREIGYAVNIKKPIIPLIIDDAPYAKSIRLDISDIDQIDFRESVFSSQKLITSLVYILNK